MTKLEAEIHDDVISILNKIKSINDNEIDLMIPEGAILFDNVINLKIIKKEAEEFGRMVRFSTNDEIGLSLISLAEGEKQVEGVMPADYTPEISQSTKSGSKMKIPSVSLPKPNMSFLKKIPVKTPILVAVIILLAVGGGVTYALNAPKAYVKVVMESQPLTKSFQIKVKKDAASNSTNKILRGIGLEADITQTDSAETTGEKLIGKKATGKVKIVNYTDQDKEFKAGMTLTYGDLSFVLDEKIIVPAMTVDSTVVPPVSTPGQIETTVTASQIGPDYNISKDKNLNVKGYKSNQFLATSTEDFKGGESKKVRVVSKDDITKLSEKVLTAAQEQAKATIKAKTGFNQRTINGAYKLVSVSQTFGAKEGDEADSVQLTQIFKVTGLVYATEEMNSLMGQLVDQMVPVGYTLSSKEREISAEALGNTDTTVLSSEEADMQVTLKTFVVADISEDSLRRDLMGKKMSDAEKVLGSIANIKTYSLEIKPNIPLLSKVPNKTENIIVETKINDE